jgi:TIR domain
MAQVFLSYTRSDAAHAAQIAKAIRDSGHSVFYDVNLAPGDSWDRRIESELAAANRVVVLWSSESVDRQWVRNEARSGMQRGILCPALIATCQVPVEFSHVQAADLRTWNGDTGHPGWAALLEAIVRTASLNETTYVPPAALPHQQVDLGIAGVALLLFFLAIIAIESWYFPGVYESRHSIGFALPGSTSQNSTNEYDGYFVGLPDLAQFLLSFCGSVALISGISSTSSALKAALGPAVVNLVVWLGVTVVSASLVSDLSGVQIPQLAFHAMNVAPTFATALSAYLVGRAARR